MDKNETVVVDNREPRSSNVGVGIAIAVLVLVVLFFLFGGFNLFTGGGQGTTETQAPTTNIETPTTTAP
jgi:hypothetical protein